jgi:chaperonin GroES
MSVNFKPLGNNLVIEPVEQEQRSAGGIILPETAKEKPQTGIVIAAGLGRRLTSGERQAMAVKEGDKVLFSKYGGTKTKLGDKELLIVSEDDILAIVL